MYHGIILIYFTENLKYTDELSYKTILVKCVILYLKN